VRPVFPISRRTGQGDRRRVTWARKSVIHTYMKQFRIRRERLHLAAVLMLVLVSALVLPALLACVVAAPKSAAVAAMAMLPFGVILRKHDDEGGGGSEDEFRSKLLRGVDGLAGSIRKLQEEQNKQSLQIVSLRQAGLVRSGGVSRQPGMLSDEAARALFADVTLHVERSGKLDSFIRSSEARDRLLSEARAIGGVTRTALTTTDIPLPSIYGSELVELIAYFGVIRKGMSHYPLTGGIAKPPRMGTRPAFGSIAMSALVPEKSPTLTFASLEPHKLGGVVVVPTEIEEGSSVMMGQFLARYGAVEFARAEDTWGFLADGSATYESIKGVCTIAAEATKLVTLAAGKTAPSDAVLSNFRALRAKVNTGALAGAAYYMSQTWEASLRSFNTAGDPYAFVYTPDGTARLDGYPIVWTEALEPYGTAAAASKNLAVFGNLRYWWFGIRSGGPRIDTSEHAYFLYDQVATRFLEEIDFDYASLEAAATLKTPAA
jgi:HK97 family phage major capsid protein